MKRDELHTFSDVLFCMEGHGVPKELASHIAALVFQWGVAAAMIRTRPPVMLPPDAPKADAPFQLSLIVNPEPKKKKEPKQAPHRIREDFARTPEHTAFAKERAFTEMEIARMWDRFKNHYLGGTQESPDWSARWRTWVMKEVEFKSKQQETRNTGF